MRHFDFTPATMAEIKRDRYRYPNPLVQERMEVLWLKAHGEKHSRIAELACVSRATVQRVLDLYEDGGLPAVRTFHWTVPLSALAPHQSVLEVAFRAHPPQTLAEAQVRIAALTGVRRGPTQVRTFLRQSLGLRWRKVAAIPVPPKRTACEHAATQAAFLKDGVGAAFSRSPGRQA